MVVCGIALVRLVQFYCYVELLYVVWAREFKVHSVSLANSFLNKTSRSAHRYFFALLHLNYLDAVELPFHFCKIVRFISCSEDQVYLDQHTSQKSCTCLKNRVLSNFYALHGKILNVLELELVHVPHTSRIYQLDIQNH
jgi:hypothetical protein